MIVEKKLQQNDKILIWVANTRSTGLYLHVFAITIIIVLLFFIAEASLIPPTLIERNY